MDGWMERIESEKILFEIVVFLYHSHSHSYPIPFPFHAYGIQPIQPMLFMCIHFFPVYMRRCSFLLFVSFFQQFYGWVFVTGVFFVCAGNSR